MPEVWSWDAVEVPTAIQPGQRDGVAMLEQTKRKFNVAGKLVSRLIFKLNARGLDKEQAEYDLNKQRIIGIQFTDRDIRDAEKKRILPQRTYKFFLDSTGHVVPVKSKATKPDVLMHLTFNTFTNLVYGNMTVQAAYRLRLIQIRYMKDVEEQEKDFLKDAGLVLKLMNKIQDEMNRK
jgi:hypothetical protein